MTTIAMQVGQADHPVSHSSPEAQAALADQADPVVQVVQEDQVDPVALEVLVDQLAMFPELPAAQEALVAQEDQAVQEDQVINRKYPCIEDSLKVSSVFRRTRRTPCSGVRASAPGASKVASSSPSATMGAVRAGRDVEGAGRRRIWAKIAEGGPRNTRLRVPSPASTLPRPRSQPPEPALGSCPRIPPS